MTTRSAILQCRLTKQEKADFQSAAATQKRQWYGVKSSSEVLRELAIEFTKKHLPKVKT